MCSSRAAARLVLGLTALASGAVWTASVARAETDSKSTGRTEATASADTVIELEVRAAMSPRAEKQLHGRRVLGLLDMELEERTPLARRATGPLGGDIIRVWIDTPSEGIAVIEVRRTSRGVTRRKLAIGRFEPDIAARVVAIAASEMVHAQARYGRRPHAPEPTPPAAVPATSEMWAGIATTAGLSALWLPAASPQWVAGPEFALAHRHGPTGQLLYARWLVNGHGEHKLRYFEVGAGADLRLVLPEPTWRFHLGARAGAVALGLPEAVAIDGVPSEPHAWSARGAAVVGIETRVPPAGWLELSVEPGALLRSLDATDASGTNWSLGGFAMNVNLALHVEAAVHEATGASRPPTAPTRAVSR